MFGVMPLLLFTFELWILLFHLFVLVTVVVATSLGAVFAPATLTEPAELMGAHAACHVITALVLFDRFATFRTLLRICHDPSYILALGWIFRVPGLAYLTVARAVALCPALEAERVSAFTVNIDHAVIFVLNALIAALVGTPTDIAVVVSVWLAVILLISGQIVTR